MLRLVSLRFSQALVVILLVSVFVFFLVHLMPGDPVLTMLGLEATDAQIVRLREEMGLNDPIIVQFWTWLMQLLSGDLGQSITYREPVLDVLLTRIPVTLWLGVAAFGIAVILGVLAGLCSAIYRGTWIDGLVTIAATLGLATPIFWLGVVAIYFFALTLGWFPTQGYVSPLDDPIQAMRHMVMPVLALSFAPMAAIARQTRSSVLEVIHQDYVRTAWSKGLARHTIMFRHVLRNALMPIMTLMGVHLNSLLGGSVVVETVFNLPGMGRLIVSSVFDKDIQVVQACILVFACLVVSINLLVDLSYGYLDPRTR